MTDSVAVCHSFHCVHVHIHEVDKAGYRNPLSRIDPVCS